MKRLWCAALLVGALALGACGDDDDDGGAPSPGDATAASSPTSAARPAGLDASFGTNGIAAVPLSASENDRFYAVAFGNDGSVYAAGFVSQAGDQAMALAKFDAAGKPEKAFGKDGVAIVNVAAGGKTAELARAVAITPNGKVLIAGPIEHDTSATGDAAKDTDVAVLRFDTTGKLDATFGKEGIARIDIGTGKATSATAFIGDNSWGLGALSSERVVFFGSTFPGGDRTDSDYALVALTSAGVLDTSFGTGGKVLVDVSKVTDNPRNLIVQKDGKIVATGYSNVDGVVQPVLIRTDSAGKLDAAFGTNGVATAKLLDGVAESYAVALQGDQYISAGYGRGGDNTEKVDMIVDRWSAAGVPDKAFGTNGIARLDLAKQDDRGRNVAALSDGRILAIGSGKKDATNVDGMIVLWTKDGKINPEFGTDGYILSDLGGPNDSWYGLAVAPDGKSAFVVGYKGTTAESGGNDDAVIARVNL